MNMQMLNDLLEGLKEHPESDLLALVIQDMLDNKFDTVDDVKSYLWDIVHYGLESGMVSGMIYTYDIRKVFEGCGDDIFDIVKDSDINLSDYDDMDSFIVALVWTAYETEASNLLNFIEGAELDEPDGEEDDEKEKTSENNNA